MTLGFTSILPSLSFSPFLLGKTNDKLLHSISTLELRYYYLVLLLHKVYCNHCYHQHLEALATCFFFLTTMVRFEATALAALALYLPASSAADRLRGSSPSSPQEAVVVTTSVEENNPFIDIQRAGIDRSLASIHVESELSFVSDEQLGALGEYISRYSVDGNTDIPETCPLDYEGDVDPYHPDSYTTLGSGRSLMGEMDMDQEMEHSHMHYVQSECNAMLDMTTCVDWSLWFDTNNITMSSEVRLFCVS
jgi:hypothetical protein